MMVIFLITTGFTGPQFWGQGFKTTLGLLEVPLLESVPDYPINLVVSYMSFIIMAYNVITSIYNVLSFCTKNEKSVIEALSGLVPFISAALATYFWLDASPYIIEKHFIIFMLFIGASFAYTLLFLILNHVIKAPFKYFNRMFLPIFFGCIQANSENWFKIPKIFTEEQECFFILICFVGSIAQYLLTTFQVIDEICRFLDIWCLAIKPKGKKNE
jgi:ethanolaminephosphotransferase